MANTNLEMYVLQRPTGLLSGPSDASLQGSSHSYGSVPNGLSRLPAGFPDFLLGESTWDDQLDETRYVHHLTVDDHKEIDAALSFFLGIAVSYPLALTSTKLIKGVL